jgi:hypothetical protein
MAKIFLKIFVPAHALMLTSLWTSFLVLPMATLHAKGKFDLTILVDDSRVVYVT